METIQVDYAAVGAKVALNKAATLAWNSRFKNAEPNPQSRPSTKNYGGIVLKIGEFEISIGQESYNLNSDSVSSIHSLHTEQVLIALALNEAISEAKDKKEKNEPLPPPWDALANAEPFDLDSYKKNFSDADEIRYSVQKLYDDIKRFKTILNHDSIAVDLFTERHPCNYNGHNQNGCEGFLREVLRSPRHKIYHALDKGLKKEDFPDEIKRISKQYYAYQRSVLQQEKKTDEPLKKTTGNVLSSSSETSALTVLNRLLSPSSENTPTTRRDTSLASSSNLLFSPGIARLSSTSRSPSPLSIGAFSFSNVHRSSLPSARELPSNNRSPFVPSRSNSVPPPSNSIQRVSLREDSFSPQRSNQPRRMTESDLSSSPSPPPQLEKRRKSETHLNPAPSLPSSREASVENLRAKLAERKKALEQERSPAPLPKPTRGRRMLQLAQLKAKQTARKTEEAVQKTQEQTKAKDTKLETQGLPNPPARGRERDQKGP